MSDRAPTHIALLRGVNVGGKNKLPMRDLATLLTIAGCDEVRTYIQSGNVVFEAPAALAARVRPSSRVESRSASAIGCRYWCEPPES